MKWAWIILTALVLIILSGSFYWFAYRPTEIKRSCSYTNETISEVKEISKGEAETSKKDNTLCKEFNERYVKAYYNCLEKKQPNYVKSSTPDADVWKKCEELEQDCKKEIINKAGKKYEFLLSELMQPSCEKGVVNSYKFFLEISCDEKHPVLEEQKGKPEEAVKRDATNEEYQKCLRNNGL